MDSDDVLKAELEKARAECERLREENAKLRLRVREPHADATSRIPTLAPQINNATQASATVRSNSSPEVKVSLFRSLFRGRDDVYALRWEGKNGRTGYSPAGIREWEQAASARRGQKRSFRLSKLFPLDEEVIRDHLLGKQTIGIYPLLEDDTYRGGNDFEGSLGISFNQARSSAICFSLASSGLIRAWLAESGNK